jgi:starch-binding outer membrane protein SusE/F
MKNRLYILFVGLLGLLSSCEEDGTKVVMLDSPVAPTLTAVPNLTLQRANGTNILAFTGTAVDPGFKSSATYFLEADAAGGDFSKPLSIKSGIEPNFQISVSDINGILLKKFTADKATSADFRIRAVLVVDAGTGARGTSANPFEYSSNKVTVNVAPYGLPRLDLLNSGIDQKIESALGNGEYTGYVKLSLTKPFTLYDPDKKITYGGSGGTLSANGAALNPVSDGWHKLSVSTNNMSYKLLDFRIGLIGDATPNGWSAPDQKMNYNNESGLWEITLNLVVGSVKFRINDDWSGSINLGIGNSDHPEYTLSNLWNSGSSQNIPIAAAGNYTIKLHIGESTYSATITKN